MEVKMGVIKGSYKRELTSLRLVDDSFTNDKSILESLKNKQNLIIISIFKYLRMLIHLV